MEELLLNIENRLREKYLYLVPSHLNSEAFLGSVMLAVKKNKEVQACPVASIMGSCMMAMQLGLLPDSLLGESFFMVRYGLVQLVPGYKGLIKLARQSGKVKSLYAETVYEGDKFSYELGLTRKLVHKPMDKSSIVPTHFYAIMHYMDGGFDFSVLTNQQVESIRDRAKNSSSEDSAWRNFYTKMGQKCAIVDLLRYAQLSTELNTAITLDDLNVANKDQSLHTIEDLLNDAESSKEVEKKINSDISLIKAEKERRKIYDRQLKLL
jgi:recombination protein RecT